MVRFFFILSLLFLFGIAKSQEFGILHGKLSDEKGHAVEGANIYIDSKIGTISDSSGFFSLEIPAGLQVKITISHLEYESVYKFFTLSANETILFNKSLTYNIFQLNQITIQNDQERANVMTRIPTKQIQVIPTTSGGIEAVLLGQLGVQKTGGDLSSQYSVRGGNFDENLVYVNDIEVYRPFLIRSGQQEGLSFTNPDMVASVLFSAGGFEARYGDKMSSVLDIKYRKPSSFGASASTSLLGASAHVEGSTQDHRFTHISGLRYKTSRYLLSSMETKGQYTPSFIDFQSYLTFDVTTNFELAFLANFAQNKYEFIPETRETRFGTPDEALALKVYFDGQELDKFRTMMGAFTGTYRPNEKKSFKLIGSAFQTKETESFDIQGQYFLNELDKQLGSDNLGDSLMNIGVGTFLEHARNYLDATVYNLSHKALIASDDNHNLLQWGLQYQYEYIHDSISEWEMRDSAGYSLPYSDTIVNTYGHLKSTNQMESFRVSAYLQNGHTFYTDSSEINLTVGIRSSYWGLSNEVFVTPRINLAYEPNWKRDFLFRFATGLYYQPAFYKELRDLEGNLNKDIKAQKSYHFVLGADYNLKMWNRPFKLIAEIYYKYLHDIIPYHVDNVRIRYLANNNATGYATGLDLKIHGEFVKGVDSWASISFMQTKEDILDDYYYENGKRMEPGYIPRPSDQLVNLALFFQDYIPNRPSYKVHLSLLYGSGLPFGPPSSERYKAVFRMDAYRRVDIGFSKELTKEGRADEGKFLKSAWVTAEVFNLLDVKNTISYLWVADIYDTQYAIPNHLTSRRLNIKLIIKL